MTVVVVVLAILLLVILVANIYIRRQIAFPSEFPPEEAVQAIGAGLGWGWKKVGGPGSINVEPGLARGGPRKRPIFSISVEPHGSGSGIQVWASSHLVLSEPIHALAYRSLLKRVQRAALPTVAASTLATANASTHSNVAPLPSLPPPLEVTTEDQARAVLDEIGQVQQAISECRRSAAGAEFEIVPRLEGVVLHYLKTASDPAQVFDVLVAPISEWAMGQVATHPDFVGNPDTPEVQARMQLMNACGDFRTKYQYLNPANV